MPDNVSTAGHGPSHGYSGMNNHLKKLLRENPKYKGEEQTRKKMFGRFMKRKKRKRIS